jgi:hypothetical protein
MRERDHRVSSQNQEPTPEEILGGLIHDSVEGIPHAPLQRTR